MKSRVGTHAGQDRTGRDRAGMDQAEQHWTGECRTGQDRTGQDRTGQDRTGQDRTGQGEQGKNIAWPGMARCKWKGEAGITEKGYDRLEMKVQHITFEVESTIKQSNGSNSLTFAVHPQCYIRHRLDLLIYVKVQA